METGKNYSSFPQVTTRGGTTRIIMPSPGSPPTKPVEVKKQKNPHEKGGMTFGIVYANALAKAEIENTKPKLAVGSIIVREKHLSAESEMPETIIAMVKREKNFSPKTGDWEFFVLDSKAEKISKRETKGNCSACHTKAKETDWVFRDYLK